MARIAVRIATGQHTDAQRLGRRECRAISDASARLYCLYSYYFGSKRERRLQAPVGCRVGREIRCAAVYRNAGADPVVHQPGVAQAGRAVAEGSFTREVLRHRRECRHLRVDAFGAIRIAEVRHQRDLIHLGQRIQTGPGGTQALRAEAQPVHAGIHLEEHPVRQLGLVRRQHIDLVLAMNHVPQAQA